MLTATQAKQIAQNSKYIGFRASSIRELRKVLSGIKEQALAGGTSYSISYKYTYDGNVVELLKNLGYTVNVDCEKYDKTRSTTGGVVDEFILNKFFTITISWG